MLRVSWLGVPASTLRVVSASNRAKQPEPSRTGSEPTGASMMLFGEQLVHAQSVLVSSRAAFAHLTELVSESDVDHGEHWGAGQGQAR